MKQLVLIIFLAWTSVAGLCQSGPVQQEIEVFFQALEAGQYRSSLDSLYADSPDILSDSVAMDEMTYQLMRLDSTYGPIKGHELIKQKFLGQSFVLLTYMGKYEFEPIRFSFEFYKPEGEWRVYGFSFDLNLVRDLEESSRDF